MTGGLRQPRHKYDERREQYYDSYDESDSPPSYRGGGYSSGGGHGGGRGGGGRRDTAIRSILDVQYAAAVTSRSGDSDSAQYVSSSDSAPRRPSVLLQVIDGAPSDPLAALRRRAAPAHSYVEETHESIRNYIGGPKMWDKIKKTTKISCKTTFGAIKKMQTAISKDIQKRKNKPKKLPVVLVQALHTQEKKQKKSKTKTKTMSASSAAGVQSELLNVVDLVPSERRGGPARAERFYIRRPGRRLQLYYAEPSERDLRSSVLQIDGMDDRARLKRLRQVRKKAKRLHKDPDPKPPKGAKGDPKADPQAPVPRRGTKDTDEVLGVDKSPYPGTVANNPEAHVEWIRRHYERLIGTFPVSGKSKAMAVIDTRSKKFNMARMWYRGQGAGLKGTRAIEMSLAMPAGTVCSCPVTYCECYGNTLKQTDSAHYEPPLERYDLREFIVKAAGYLYLGTLVSIILGRRMGKFENTFAGNFMKYMDAIRHGMSRLPPGPEGVAVIPTYCDSECFPFYKLEAPEGVDADFTEQLDNIVGHAAVEVEERRTLEKEIAEYEISKAKAEKEAKLKVEKDLKEAKKKLEEEKAKAKEDKIKEKKEKEQAEKQKKEKEKEKEKEVERERQKEKERLKEEEKAIEKELAKVEEAKKKGPKHGKHGKHAAAPTTAAEALAAPPAGTAAAADPDKPPTLTGEIFVGAGGEVMVSGKPAPVESELYLF
ncbi:uncharacterized protein LOC105391047 [Plutella xylostella]|uniref:uncharacterized protein LOC105391047 n=1 Tax=Plutella xylostella TaxID=51655 RepID=UPI002032F868|nr:uncharacterized protein LOC105391047 [Plutella xylostella]XP_048485195.1 uncharacterized protein LOC105391047 [Plutella xylostella]